MTATSIRTSSSSTSAKPVVAAPIVGATKPHHLADAVAALDLELTDDEIAALEEHYTPRIPTYYRSESGY